MTISKGYDNVFDALEDDPGMAQNLKIRADLMDKLTRHIKIKKLTQKSAAELFGVTQPRVSDLKTGKINKFTIDVLVNMLMRVGRKVELKEAA